MPSPPAMGPSPPCRTPLTGALPRGNSGHSRLSLWLGGPLVCGVLVGLAVPLTDGSASEPAPWGRISAAIGWAYFCAWSVSFYPQVVQNLKRRSVVGLSLDYQLLNLAGFACYFAFNAALFWSPGVQREYRDMHDGKSSAVRLNDVIFAGHALALTAVTLLQIVFFYDYPPLDKADRVLRFIVCSALVTLVIGCGGVVVAIMATNERAESWLSFLVGVSEVKVAISVVKYCPQVFLNIRRRSTDGWNIVNVLLDFLGGLLSVAQLLLDAWASHDWSAVTGDPAKLLLGNVSMFFDVIFMVQHYCLYGDATAAAFTVV